MGVMGEERKKNVFISYSWQDSSIADEVRKAIPPQFDVWFDKERVQAGDEISRKIMEGMEASDYYVVLISENSMQSNWVKREISTAFDLADSKKLSVVPLIFDSADVPLEFRGLLYIDLRKSLSSGLQSLREFFISQASAVDDIEPRHKILKSHDERTQKRMICNEILREMSLGELRYLVTERLSLEDVETVWFDIFGRRMTDEVRVQNLALSSVELIDRSRRTEVLVELMDTLCRNYPYITK